MPFKDEMPHILRSGSIAGAFSAFTFAVVHHVFISDIWFSVVPMMAAGALCGLCISWSYALLPGTPSRWSWLRYNLLYVAALALLGLASVLTFEPVTTVAALMEMSGPPEALIGQAMPLTASFTLASAVLIGALYGFNWARFGAILLACTVLVLLLGLNVSVIGLVFIPRGSLYLVIELFALILALGGVYAAGFAALERKRLNGRASAHHGGSGEGSGAGLSQSAPDGKASILGNITSSTGDRS